MRWAGHCHARKDEGDGKGKRDGIRQRGARLGLQPVVAWRPSPSPHEQQQLCASPLPASRVPLLFNQMTTIANTSWSGNRTHTQSIEADKEEQ